MSNSQKYRDLGNIICSFFGIAAATLACCAIVDEESEPIDFYQDLLYIRDTLIENHPGMHNNLDPDFKEHLEDDFLHAQKLLLRATSADQRALILQDFGKSFKDTHLWVRYTLGTAKGNGSTAVQKKSPSIHEIVHGVHWAKIPHFEPAENQIAEFKSIISLLPTLRDQTIIFDLRGNGGGNSSWGDQILGALFGTQYVDHKIRAVKSHQYVEWRASKGNVAYIQSLIPAITKEFGEQHEVTDWIKKVYQGLHHALLMQEHYYVEPSETATPNPVEATQSLFRGTIIAIIDKGCGSACLDFIDGLKEVNADTIFIGETTAADSVYMELRTVSLPSGKGSMGFPIKVYRNRPRGHNAPHVPTIEYNDLKNDQNLRTFALEMLAAIR